MKGDAVTAAAVPVVSLGDLVDRVPEAHERLVAALEQLDAALGSAVELEFAVERSELWCLQLRTFTIVEKHEQLPLGAAIVAEGQPASAGVGRGRVQVDIDDALDAIDRDEPVVLVLETSTLSDMASMVRSAAVVTVIGGRESHAAVVTRGTGGIGGTGSADRRRPCDVRRCAGGGRGRTRRRWHHWAYRSATH